MLRFEDDAPSEAVSDALLNRSLFSARRVVELDISRLLGTESPGRLVTKALEAWAKGGAGGSARGLQARAGAARGARPAGGRRTRSRTPRRRRSASARRTTRRCSPRSSRSCPRRRAGVRRCSRPRCGCCSSATENDGTVALLTAVSPPAGVDLLQEITARGLVLETSVGNEPGPALRRLAETKAKEREVAVELRGDRSPSRCGPTRTRRRSPRSSGSCSNGRARAAACARRTSRRTSRTSPPRTSTGSSTPSGAGTRATRSSGSSGSSTAAKCARETGSSRRSRRSGRSSSSA